MKSGWRTRIAGWLASWRSLRSTATSWYSILSSESSDCEFHRKERRERYTDAFVTINSGNCHQGPDTGEAGETGRQRHSRRFHAAAGGGGLMLSDQSQDAKKRSGVPTARSGGDNTEKLLVCSCHGM
jgi:hypothetical protein